jgi:hypothetical protein
MRKSIKRKAFQVKIAANDYFFVQAVIFIRVKMGKKWLVSICHCCNGRVFPARGGGRAKLQQKNNEPPKAAQRIFGQK